MSQVKLTHWLALHLFEARLFNDRFLWRIVQLAAPSRPIERGPRRSARCHCLLRVLLDRLDQVLLELILRLVVLR